MTKSVSSLFSIYYALFVGETLFLKERMMDIPFRTLFFLFRIHAQQQTCHLFNEQGMPPPNRLEERSAPKRWRALRYQVRKAKQGIDTDAGSHSSTGSKAKTYKAITRKLTNINQRRRCYDLPFHLFLSRTLVMVVCFKQILTPPIRGEEDIPSILHTVPRRP